MHKIKQLLAVSYSVTDQLSTERTVHTGKPTRLVMGPLLLPPFLHERCVPTFPTFGMWM